LIPPTMWGYNDDVQDYTYDPEKAKLRRRFSPSRSLIFYIRSFHAAVSGLWHVATEIYCQNAASAGLFGVNLGGIPGGGWQ
ncbi:hypothetical protein O5629_27810, partial [Escherichia coli]|nr:hypothetical protein [Escherichia coli]